MTSPNPNNDNGQRVDFHTSYKHGKVYVFPQIKESRVKHAFEKIGGITTPIDKLLPGATPAKPFKIDEEKIARSNDNFEGDKSEAAVVKLLYGSLSKFAQPQDLPCFLFVGRILGEKEKDVIIFHRRLGVVVVEVKTLANEKVIGKVRRAATQALEARDTLMQEVQASVNLMVALPNLEKRHQQMVENELKAKGFDLVQPICGTDTADYDSWLEQVSTQVAPDEWADDQAYVTAVSKYLGVERFSDCEGTLEHAGFHRTWLLTPGQADILHCEDSLLHLCGPPGAGKTLLLLHRAKRWLAEDKSLVLAVGESPFSVLLEHLNRATRNDQQLKSADKRMALCRDQSMFEATVEELRRRRPDKEVCVVIDEAHPDFLSTALEVFKAKKMVFLWTAEVADIPKELSGKFHQLGGRSVLLEHSLRCPPHIANQANEMRVPAKTNPEMSAYPYLRATHLTASIKAVYHPCHHAYQRPGNAPPDFDCTTCAEWLRSSLSPLVDGLSKDDPKWRQWIVIGTGSFGDDSGLEEAVVRWLRTQGVPALWELPFQGTSNLPLSSSSQSREEDAEWREQLASGLDHEECPAVHVVDGSSFLGMEKSGVLVIHFDARDDDPDYQSKEEREERKNQHRKDLFHAMTRSHSELAICFLSPSPAASLLKQLEPEVRKHEEKLRRKAQEETARMDQWIFLAVVVVLVGVFLSIWRQHPF